MVDAIEALADGIMSREGWHAGSRSNRNRNPGNLRDSSLKSGEDAGGYAIFPSFVVGYNALTNDLKDKFVGLTRTGLSPESTFAEFMNVYAPSEDHNDPASYCQFLCGWLRMASGITVTPETLLGDIWKPPAAPGS